MEGLGTKEKGLMNMTTIWRLCEGEGVYGDKMIMEEVQLQKQKK